jgi:mRNA interferase RelE/StbE
VYEVEISSAAERDLEKIPKEDILSRIDSSIQALKENPHPPHQSRKLEGSKNQWRIRIGEYRIVYEIDKKNHVVTILKIGLRKDIYR